ncbi:hypothetical protein CTAYLR_005618 [Chrysophaeum taylorii]|uniref:Protein kinase domain-containing protein n=1 Tax=Chrysophaeum taylorii TaxID=2483200 RepID=A0AAD7U8L0_9STRA|nr:hypothetical protein CTAYLR_005618 [Chrysophaeum taylorii]
MAAMAADSKTVADGLLAGGETMPGLAAVCTAAKTILDDVVHLQLTASDVTVAGARVAKTLVVLQMCADNANKVQMDEAAERLVAKLMSQLNDLMLGFQRHVESFEASGWLRRKWGMLDHGPRLTELDTAIVVCLRELRLAYQLLDDRRVASLLDAQKYELEEAMLAQVRRVMQERSLDEVSASLVLSEDDEVNTAVAKAARVPRDELDAELGELRSRAGAGTGNPQTNHDVVEPNVSEGIPGKASLIHKHEIRLESIESEPFAMGSVGRLHRGTYARNCVAVKLISLSGLSVSRRTKLMGEFTKEMTIMLSLRSPFVVQVFGTARYQCLILSKLY